MNGQNLRFCRPEIQFKSIREFTHIFDLQPQTEHRYIFHKPSVGPFHLVHLQRLGDLQIFKKLVLKVFFSVLEIILVSISV